MKTFRVKHNFAASQPAWRGDFVRMYGERNEGFLIEAKDRDEAKRVLREKHNLNPFYVTVKEEQS